jgi:hypothetical protein
MGASSLSLSTRPRARCGTMRARCLQLGANTPWKRVRLSLGLGTRAANLAMAAPGHPCARGIPFILNLKSNGSSTTWVEPSRKGRL